MIINVEGTLWNKLELEALVKRLYSTAVKYPQGSKNYKRFMELGNYYASFLNNSRKH